MIRVLTVVLILLVFAHESAHACEGCGMPTRHCRTLQGNERTFVLHRGSLWSFNDATKDTTVWWSSAAASDPSYAPLCKDKSRVMYCKLLSSENSGAPQGAITKVTASPSGRIVALTQLNEVGVLEHQRWTVFPALLDTIAPDAYNDSQASMAAEPSYEDPAYEALAVAILDRGDSIIVFTNMYADVIYPSTRQRFRRYIINDYGSAWSVNDSSIRFDGDSKQYTLGLDFVPTNVRILRDSTWETRIVKGVETEIGFPTTPEYVAAQLKCPVENITVVDSLNYESPCQHNENQLISFRRSTVNNEEDEESLEAQPFRGQRVQRRNRIFFDAAIDVNGTIYAGTTDGLLVFRPLAHGEAPPPDLIEVRAPYPQPAKTEVTLAVDGFVGQTMEVSILDASGRMRMGPVTGASTGTTLNVSSLEPSTYTALININNTTRTARVVVMR